MNIVFIVVDCLRWDYLSSNGYPRPTTPGLDKIAAESCVFDRAYATINQTDMSLTSIFSGVYPLTHGLEKPAAFTPPDELAKLAAWKMEYLPQLLGRVGYMAIGYDWLDRWHQWGYDWYWVRDRQRWLGLLRKAASLLPSIASPIAQILQRMPGGIGRSMALHLSKPTISAESVTDGAIRFLKRFRGEDTFLMLHYWDAHTPYDNQQSKYLNQMRETSLPGEDMDARAIVGELCQSEERKAWLLTHVVANTKTLGDLTTQYCAEIRAVDAQIERLYDFLVESDAMDQTIFVVTADHGENLIEDGYFFEHSGVGENVLHVPLLMKFPGISSYRTEQFVSHVDLLPTLADYIGLEPVSTVDGLSLIPILTDGKPLDREGIYFQSRLQAERARWGMITQGGHKYIESRSVSDPRCKWCGANHDPLREIYDLADDPHTENNLAESHPDLTKATIEIFRGMIMGMEGNASQLAPSSSDIDDEVYTESERAQLESHLRSLGYFD